MTCVTPVPNHRQAIIMPVPPGREVKQFFLQGEIDGVPVRWLVLRSADGAVMLLDEHLVQEVVSSTWATTTFSRLDVKEATDARPNVGTEPPAYTVTLGSGTIIVGYLVKAQRASKLVTSNTLYDFRSAHVQLVCSRRAGARPHAMNLEFRRKRSAWTPLQRRLIHFHSGRVWVVNQAEKVNVGAGLRRIFATQLMSLLWIAGGAIDSRRGIRRE